MTADETLARIEERVTALRRDLTRIEDEHITQKARVEELQAVINGHGQTVALLTPEYKAVSKTVADIEETVGELRKVVNDIEKWRQRVIGFAVAVSALTSGGVYGLLEAFAAAP